MKNTCYRDILQNQMQLRREKNKSYSLRAFAKDIGISPSALSEILRTKKGLSEKKAKEISKKLRLSTDEEKFFIDLVLSEHARSPKKKELAKMNIKEFKKITPLTIHNEAFSLISNWYHFAILELTHLKAFKPCITWIAKKLEISENETLHSKSLLKQLGLLEVKDNKWIDTEEDLATSDGKPLLSLKKYHGQLIDKAREALYNQSIDERDITNLMIGIDVDDLSEIKKDIREFKKNLIEKYGKNQKRNDVYCLGINLFSLTRKEKSL